MTSWKVESIKDFMAIMLSSELFDDFLIIDAEIRTLITTKINGTLQNGYLTEEEKESLGLDKLASWKQIRPIVFDLVKGKRSPSVLIINFVKVLENGDKGFFRVHYMAGELNIITAYQAAEFIMERGKETEWDEWCHEFLRKLDIDG